MTVSEPLKGSETLENRIGSEHKRRNLRKAAGGMGIFSLIGVGTFLGELFADRPVALPTTLFFVSGILFGIAAIIFWRDSFRARVPNEELKPTASPSSLVE